MRLLADVDPRVDGVPLFPGTDGVVVAAGDWQAAAMAADGCGRVATVDVRDWGPVPPVAWPTGQADLVVLAGVLRLVRSPTALLDEAIGRLRPGGALVLLEPMRGPASPAATRHLDAMDLGAVIEAARGVDRSPVFGRLQLGSLIQGYGLADLGFSDATPADDAEPIACQRAADLWRVRFEEAAADEALAEELRTRAQALAAALAAEGLALAPAMRVWGRKAT